MVSLNRMPSARAFVCVALIALGCQSAIPTTNVAPNETTTIKATASPPFPTETDIPPLVPVTADEIETALPGPAVLYGQGARNGRRGDAPGRHGNLLLAIDSPYQVFGRSASYFHVAAWSTD